MAWFELIDMHGNVTIINEDELQKLHSAITGKEWDNECNAMHRLWQHGIAVRWYI